MSKIYYDRNELADWELEIEDSFQEALKEGKLQVHYHGDRSHELAEQTTKTVKIPTSTFQKFAELMKQANLQYYL